MKKNFKNIVTYHIGEYGNVELKLDKILKEKGITRNYLRTLTGVKYDVISRYYKGSEVSWVDLDFLAKVCYVLDCKIEDLLEYKAPAASETEDKAGEGKIVEEKMNENKK